MKKKRKNLEIIEGRWMGLSLALILIFSISFPAVSQAQCKLKNTAMQNGEEVTYDLFFHWGLLWKNAGTAIYKTESTTYEGETAHKMSLLLSTNKGADTFFKMRDTIESIVSHDLVPLYYKKAAEEGKRYTIDEAVYKYINGQTIVNQQRTWKDGEVAKYEYKENECVYDMISILAKARAMDLRNYKKGDRINLPLATGRRIDQIILEFRGTENVKTENKTTFKCIVFTLINKDKKNKEKDFITFYVSDDKNFLPIKLDLNLNFGSAQVVMKSIKGQKFPLESIVKKK